MLKPVTACLLLAVASCATPATAPQRWTGVYETSFEVSAFRPEGTREQWWVTPANEDAATQLSAAIPHPPERPPWGSARVTLEGYRSATGHYGHLGAYERTFRVTQVIAASPPP